MKKLILSTFFLFFPILAIGQSTSHVQNVEAVASSVTQLDATFSTDVTAGNIIACAFKLNDSTTTVTSFGYQAGTASIAAFTSVITDIGPTRPIWGRYTTVSTGGTLTLRLVVSATTNLIIKCDEISGGDTSDPLFGSEAQHDVDSGSGTDAITSGTGVVSIPSGSYLFGFEGIDNGSFVTHNVGTDYTVSGTEGNNTAEHIANFSGGTKAATFTCPTCSASTDHNVLLMVFDPPTSTSIPAISSRRRQ